MLEEEVTFDIPHLDFTTDLIVAGIFGGACFLAFYIVAKHLLRHNKKSIPWRFLSNYYAASTPLVALLFALHENLSADNQMLDAFLLAIGITQIPLLPIHAMAAMILIPGFVGRAFVFVLHWIAWSAEPSTLNLNSQD